MPAGPTPLILVAIGFLEVGLLAARRASSRPALANQASAAGPNRPIRTGRVGRRNGST